MAGATSATNASSGRSSGAMRPRQRTGSCGACGFDGVAHVLAVALADLAQRLVLGTVDRATVAGVGPRLLAADEELGRAVNARPGAEAAVVGVVLGAVMCAIRCGCAMRAVGGGRGLGGECGAARAAAVAV